MDVLIVLTGRRKHGKDSVADIVMSKFGGAGKIALADWFKAELSNEFHIPLEDFYDCEKKDALFDKPIVLTRPTLRRLMQRLSVHGYMNYQRVSVSKWVGRQIKSIRDLMLWFGHDLVTLNCGDVFHCQVTEKNMLQIPRKHGFNIILITDARMYEQSKYFVNRNELSYPILVVRPGGSSDDHPVESSNSNFPENYFYATITNDGTLEDLEEKVKQLLSGIKEDVMKKVPTNEPKGVEKGEINNE